MDRVILHSDMNSFYASVEIMLNPELRNKPVAVGGSTEERHGIILTKNQIAKKYGIKTGMVNWEAKLLCPDLVIITPHYEQYIKYSKMAREIYSRYTDKIEPFGMDECWLDMTESTELFGNGFDIANNIRKTIKSELGLTVSIGVSFNKIFAKLGSDMKKPDAITVINRENYKDKVWNLPVEDLFYVGPATKRKLNSIGVQTIGNLAKFPVNILKDKLGKNGIMLSAYANGADTSPVMPQDFESQIKSIGHGLTFVRDLKDNNDAWQVIFELSQNIGKKLRKHHLLCGGIQLSIRTSNLRYKQWQSLIDGNSRSVRTIAHTAQNLLETHFNWNDTIRSLTVRAIYLVPDNIPYQRSLFVDDEKNENTEKLERTVEVLRNRFGPNTITYASLLNNDKIPNIRLEEMIMPKLLSR